MLGKVKWFNDLKGYGFLNTDDLKDDVFIHYSNIICDGYKTLNEGDNVEFILNHSVEKGFYATHILKK